MVTKIAGKHMDVGESLQQYVHSRLDNGVKTELDNITQSQVIFSKHSYLYHAEIVIHDSHVGLIRADGESEDAYSSFDMALVKMEKQLRKYKSKIKRHVKSIKEVGFDSKIIATKYILESQKEISEHEPVTIAERPSSIERLTVSEAIMKMDLAHLPALLFVNNQTQRINLVYHRTDGNISWVDPGDI